MATRKQDGYIGLDYVDDATQVDHVLDLTKDPYPFEDRSVDAVFSAHFLEHIEEPNHVFSEIGRIAKDGAKIEFWTPYTFTNEAFVYGHLHFLTEEMWMHFCVLAPRRLPRHARRPLAAATGSSTSIPPEVQAEIEEAGFSLDFAVRYMKGVVDRVRGRDRVPRGPGRPGRRPRTGVRDRPVRGERQPLVRAAKRKRRRSRSGKSLGAPLRNARATS